MPIYSQQKKKRKHVDKTSSDSSNDDKDSIYVDNGTAVATLNNCTVMTKSVFTKPSKRRQVVSKPASSKNVNKDMDDVDDLA